MNFLQRNIKAICFGWIAGFLTIGFFYLLGLEELAILGVVPAFIIPLIVMEE